MQALIDELKHPIYQGLSDQEAANLINLLTVTRRKPVKVADLKSYAMQKGFYPDIVIDAQQATDLQRRKLCLALWLWIDDPGGRIEHADLDLPKAKESLDGLVAYGYITAQQRIEIDAMASKTIRWVDEIGIGEVGIGYVRNARKMIEVQSAQ